jgi:hypothetical protein
MSSTTQLMRVALPTYCDSAKRPYLFVSGWRIAICSGVDALSPPSSAGLRCSTTAEAGSNTRTHTATGRVIRRGNARCVDRWTCSIAGWPVTFSAKMTPSQPSIASRPWMSSGAMPPSATFIALAISTLSQLRTCGHRRTLHVLGLVGAGRRGDNNYTTSAGAVCVCVLCVLAQACAGGSAHTARLRTRAAPLPLDLENAADGHGEHWCARRLPQ